MDIQDIVQKAGGANEVAEAVSLSIDSVKRKWPVNGIPDRYWPTLIELSNGALTPQDLYDANLKARTDEATP